jgi:hypothetical protein
MKLLFHALILSVIVGSTDADRMIRMLFNKGVTPTDAMFCSTSDNAHIDKVFKPIKRVRYLREATTMTTNTNVTSTDFDLVHTHVDRELWPTYCKNNCAGYEPGTCRATNCVGYRKKNRRQMQTLTCADQVQAVHAELDDVMMTKVSSTCALYLTRANRIAECFDDVIYGVVENFVLWKSNKKSSFVPKSEFNPMQQTFTMVNNLKSLGTVTNGFNVCHYDRINIEAVVNPCVKFINATLTHPDGFTVSRTESDIPYTVFGDDKNTPMGRELPLFGTYTFTAIPDNFDYKKSSITFNVVRCGD